VKVVRGGVVLQLTGRPLIIAENSLSRHYVIKILTWTSGGNLHEVKIFGNISSKICLTSESHWQDKKLV